MPDVVTVTRAVEPFRADPGHAAILLDVDGTLAPIVPNADDATVPETTRTLLAKLARRYALVACVSGRRAATARRLVSLDELSYVGNHGSERLLADSDALESLDELTGWEVRVHAFVRAQDGPQLRRAQVRVEDKGPIVAYHWREAPDERAAVAQVERLASAAERAGLATHLGRKILEVRPPVAISKGAGVAWLLRDLGDEVETALYAGDDMTDVDVFHELERLEEAGRLTSVLGVGVRSGEETPADLEREADLLVDGTSGVIQLLEALLA